MQGSDKKLQDKRNEIAKCQAKVCIRNMFVLHTDVGSFLIAWDGWRQIRDLGKQVNLLQENDKAEKDRYEDLQRKEFKVAQSLQVCRIGKMSTSISF